MMSQPTNEAEGAGTPSTAIPVKARHVAHCLRCGYQWFPRVPEPAQCPCCHSVLWNTPRAQQLPGKPAPTRKGKRRGVAFTSESATKANQRKARLAAQQAEQDNADDSENDA